DGTYTFLGCGPAGRDIDFTADCHFAATDDGHSGFVKVVRIGFATEDSVGKQLELYIDGTADIASNGDRPAAQLNLSRLIGGDRVFNVRMCVVDDRYEFLIDGRRVFYGPLPTNLTGDDRRLTLAVQTVGVSGAFTDAHWRVTDDKHD